MFLKDKKCLFIGKKNCTHSKKSLYHLTNLCDRVTFISSNHRAENLSDKILKWKGDFIFSYANYKLLSPSILDSAKILNLNFHPGTPSFPGSGSSSWAIYKGVNEFGITVHIMNEKFDNGKILKVYSFKIDKNVSLNELLLKTESKRMSAFIKYINYLNSLNEFSIKKLYKKKSSFRWSKNLFKISDLNKMRCLKINMSTHEINKRIKAFHMRNYPVFFEIKGKKYIYSEK